MPSTASAAAPRLDGLLPALRRLDRLLGRAISAAQAGEAQHSTDDPFRGLYIDDEELARLLARQPGEPMLQADQAAHAHLWPEGSDASARLAGLARTFGLSAFDQDLILVGVAPELDLRYERLYAYLQDDVTRRRPTIDLALNLLCSSAETKLARRDHVAPGAPLIRNGIVRLVPDPSQPQPPLLALYLTIDEQILRWLLGQEGVDPRLRPCCRVVAPAFAFEELVLGDAAKHALATLATQARDAERPLRLYFHGPRGSGKCRTGEALAGSLGMGLLVVDLPALVAGAEPAASLALAFREARLYDAVLYLDGLDAVRGDEQAWTHRCLVDLLAEQPGITVLAGEQPWTPAPRSALGPLGVLGVAFPVPSFAQQRACWERSLAPIGVALDDRGLDALSDRFRLTPGQISDAVAAAGDTTAWRAAARPGGTGTAQRARPTVEELFAAARAQSNHNLATLARKIEPAFGWSDIVLPANAAAQLREIVSSVKHRHVVYDDWGFGRRLSLGTGLNVLFSGPSGTGKTMAAEVIAGDLALELYKVDLSQVVSKYIGDTEKNLDRIFREAHSSNGILMFDEADALFGKRSEVKDAHDRYANIETGYLLQKMEEYEGVAILATNLRANLDAAFARRMHFTVEFPFPDEEHRLRIWRGIFPPEAPLAGDVDIAALARSFKLSGGNIKNVAVAAAFLAAAESKPIGMAQLLRAAKREFQKVGQAWEEPGAR
jgi:AAA+ superfamily predicted ATPase